MSNVRCETGRNLHGDTGAVEGLRGKAQPQAAQIVTEQEQSTLRLWINQRGDVLHVADCSMRPPFPTRQVDYDGTTVSEAVVRALTTYPRLRPHTCAIKASKADILPLPFYGALARAHALAAGVEKWWDVTTWPTEAEETTLERGIND